MVLLGFGQLMGTVWNGAATTPETEVTSPKIAQNVILANTSGALSLNLDEYEIGASQEYIMELEVGVVYNFSLQGTGQGTFEVSVLNEYTETVYRTQQTTVGYTDETLLMAGVPLWGDYDNWNAVEYLGATYSGVSISVGVQKDFLLYLDPSLDVAYRTLMWAVTLAGTLDPLNNTLEVEWQEITLEAAPEIVRSDNETSYQAVLDTESITPVKFGTENGEDLTHRIINQTTTTNGSAIMVNWEYDLSGNLVRKTVPLAGIQDINEIYVPQFKNLLLDGTPSFGLLINTGLINDVNFGLNFSETGDTTYQYEEMESNTATGDFLQGEGNIAWKVVELPDPGYFDITIGNISDPNGLYWDVSAEFYALGAKIAPLFELDSLGVNASETAAIFTAGQNTAYLDRMTTAYMAEFDPHHIWWGEYGLDKPEVMDTASTQYLGIKLTALSPLAVTNYSCPIILEPRAIGEYTDGFTYEIGSENGLPVADSDLFHVRSFPISDFSQYKWMMQSDSSPDVVDWKLICRSLATYEDEMNNALISDTFNSTGLTGAITLSFDMAADLRNDDLYVYIQNSTTQSQLDSFTGTIISDTHTYDISAWNDSDMQIIFNMTTDDRQLASGPVIDNVEVSNGTDAVFFDNFSTDHEFQWVQVDNTEKNQLLWHIEADEQSFNRPALDIIYPNQIYTFTGYAANPYVYSEFTKTALAYNPMLQGSSTAYLVVKPSETVVIQNFTATIGIQEFSPVKLDEGSLIKADHTYNQLVYEDYTYQEEILEYAGFYEYFYLDVAEDTEYSLEFQPGQEDKVLFYSTLLSQTGQLAGAEISNHFGLFVANISYPIEAGAARKIYIQFDAIEPGFEITVKLEIVKDVTVGWKIATAVLSATTALPIAYVLYDKRALLKLGKKKTKDITAPPAE